MQGQAEAGLSLSLSQHSVLAEVFGAMGFPQERYVLSRPHLCH